MSDRLLAELRSELETIRRTAEIALEKLARLGAGFGPPPEVGPSTQDTWDERVRRVRDVLPGDLLPKLTIVEQYGEVLSIAAEWLGRPDWGRVDSAVKSMGGKWIRAGKESRWEVQVP